MTSTTQAAEAFDLSVSYDELMQTVVCSKPSPELHENAAEGTSLIRLQKEGRSVELDVLSKKPDADPGQILSSSTKGASDESVGIRGNSSSAEPSASTPPLRVAQTSTPELTSRQRDFAESDSMSFPALERSVFELAEAFRKDVMAKMEAMKDSLAAEHAAEMSLLVSNHDRQVSSLSTELTRQRDLNAAFEKTLRRKDETIANLLECVKREKERNLLSQSFVDWRSKVQDSDKFESPQYKLAKRFYHAKLRRKALSAWTRFAREGWRRKVEERAEEKNKAAVATVEKECDARMLTLQSSLSAARGELDSLHAERDAHEERVRAALMRGVCALNLETMSALSTGNSVKSCPSSESFLINGGTSTQGSSFRSRNVVEEETPRTIMTFSEFSPSSQSNQDFLNGVRRGPEPLSSTPETEYSNGPVPRPLKTSLDFLNRENETPGRSSTNVSTATFSVPNHNRHQHQNGTSLPSRGWQQHPQSSSRRSCGVNPLAAGGREKGAQVKTLPHNTIVIERHVQRS